MTVDGALQAQFFLFSLLAGLLFAAFCEALRLLPSLFGLAWPPEWTWRFYERPLPLLGVPLGLPRVGKFRLSCLACLRAVAMLTVPPLGALLLALVAFVYNNGVLRPLALLLFLLGYFLWRGLVGSRLSSAFALCLLAFRIVFCYFRALLLLPFLVLWKIFRRVALAPLMRLWRTVLFRYRLARTARLCLDEVAAAALGFDAFTTII